MSTSAHDEYNNHTATGSINSLFFQIFVVQHPLRARMCGFGEKDRRTIDPPPAVQLKFFNQNWEPVELTEAEVSSMIVSASLWSQDGLQPCSLVVDPSSIPASSATCTDKGIRVLSLGEPKKINNLIGTTVSSSFFLLDHNNESGVFFIFNDLSIRTEGRFRLRFTFVNIESIDVNSKVLAEITSNVFGVYSAKKFPGMTPSTPLSKAFSEQGIRIPIRTRSYVKNKTKTDLDENANDEPGL
ncbi:hypothetical protein BB560_002948 [Smittium megazygosporum]|uniref:Velvet domain-containing protein n=1 Tax=Smittium megazygosporum TaxID=133381 RepID=A0A2T9ZDE3_9FUNG|nr:hypothetical protein BB560_002948 [Smittium megazygosporum]